MFHKLLYRCSLSGMGILNFESDRLSGEGRFLRDFLGHRQDAIVFDVGANVGRYARGVFEVCPRAAVHAFEPHPVNFAQLVKSCPGHQFSPVNAAAGAQEGTFDLYDYEDEDGSSHASLHKGVFETIHRKPTVAHQVQVVPLAAYVAQKGIEKITLLKVDTEGNELGVLLGLESMLREGRIEAIHFEFNEMNVVSRSFFLDFWKLLPNYRFYRMLPDGLVEIEKYNPLYCEIFAFQNIVAMLRKPGLDKR